MPGVDLLRHPIALALERGVLVMEGEVADAGAKKLALSRAASLPGIHHIVDRLRVAPARHMSDAEIRDHLRDALGSEPVFNGCAVRISSGAPPMSGGAAGPRPAIDGSVEGGIVTLAGEVPSLGHKRLAGVLAWWIPGTRDVVNGLEVAPPERDGDDEITDAVHLALDKDPLVDGSQVAVTTRRAIVTLGGSVASAEQREMAELDAWFVFGVEGVANGIAVRPP
ncbi:BON domain-containing protein [Anaeromyxobacter terrae]|uniref:BON domain-containing protein n=1 Tax=Anaeromyxobacter terrae TaxID=2925406 RepID=UPI001F59AEA6|nr:BON domain-containing protein [Anaeromyxobacter sp. SG22]